MTALESAFAVNSPRLMPRGAALAGWSIHIAVIALWVALFAQVFLQVGAGLWSIGIAYIAYDTLLLAFVVWQTLPLRRAARPAPVSGGPTVAVLIAAFNEAPVLPATLRALLAQTKPPEQIVVADDGSDDDTAAMLEAEFGDRHPSLRLLQLPHGGKAAALNAALLTVDTDVVVTMDADTLPAPDAIAAMSHRVRGRRGPRRGGRCADSDMRGEPSQPDAAVVPDLRIPAQLRRTLRVDAGELPAADFWRIRGVPARRRARGRWIRHRLSGRGLRAHPPDATAQPRRRPRVAGADRRQRRRADRRARHGPRLPASAAPLVRRLPADAVLEPGHDRQSAATAHLGWRCCR